MTPIVLAVDSAGCDRNARDGFGPAIPFSSHRSPQDDWSHGFVFGVGVSFPAASSVLPRKYDIAVERNQPFPVFYQSSVKVREDVAALCQFSSFFLIAVLYSNGMKKLEKDRKS